MLDDVLHQRDLQYTMTGHSIVVTLKTAGKVKQVSGTVVDSNGEPIHPMIERVIQNDGFYEWYGKGGVPSGSGNFKGSAGVLSKAIELLRDWAEKNKS